MAEQRITFLLGAGASKASQTQCEAADVSPTGPQLLASLAESEDNRISRVWGPIRQEVLNSNIDPGNFEQVVESLKDGHFDAAISPSWRNRAFAAVAQFFSRFTDREGSVYDELCARMARKGWTGAVFTLNYDTLFLQAANRRGLSFYNPRIVTQLGRNTHDPNLSGRQQEDNGRYLYYPHGTSNLFEPSLYRSASPGQQINEGALLNTSDSTYAIEVKTSLAPIFSDFPRLMAYYDNEKSVPFPTRFPKAEQMTLAQHLDERVKGDVVVILGCSAPESNNHDNHIWGPIKNTKAKLIYCSGESQASRFRAWLHEQRQGMHHVVCPYRIQNRIGDILQGTTLGE